MIRIGFLSTLTAVALLGTGAASCSTAGSSSGTAPAPSSVVLGSPSDDSALADRATLTISNEASSGSAEIDAELRLVWRALQDVIAEHELPVAQLDASAGRLQVGGRMPRVDRKRMSHWFDCGRSMTGPVADRSTIELAMAFQLRATASETTLLEYSTRAAASPRDNPGNTLACSSEGRLETFVVGAGMARVGSGR